MLGTIEQDHQCESQPQDSCFLFHRSPFFLRASLQRKNTASTSARPAKANSRGRAESPGHLDSRGPLGKTDGLLRHPRLPRQCEQPHGHKAHQQAYYQLPQKAVPLGGSCPSTLAAYSEGGPSRWMTCSSVSPCS